MIDASLQFVWLRETWQENSVSIRKNYLRSIRIAGILRKFWVECSFSIFRGILFLVTREVVGARGSHSLNRYLRIWMFHVTSVIVWCLAESKTVAYWYDMYSLFTSLRISPVPVYCTELAVFPPFFFFFFFFRGHGEFIDFRWPLSLIMIVYRQ